MRLGLCLITVLLTACSQPDVQVQSFGADAYPQKLSQWGLFNRDGERLTLSDGVVPYELNTPLFTDYAQKLRTVWMPPGTTARYRDSETFDFPVGTIISKTFFYPINSGGLVKADYQGPGDTLDTTRLKIMETRLLVRQEDGWDALPYVWRGDDAYLKIAGDLEMLEIAFPDGETTSFPYIIPSRNQCASCHATNHSSGELQPIGPKARHLNRDRGDGNQLQNWQAAGILQGLPPLDQVAMNASFDDPDADVDHKARAYLDANCGHCHNAHGAADTSGLLLDAGISASRPLGICKPPIAAGGGTGGRAYSIVPGHPEQSILTYRVKATDPGTMMPELGRTLVHAEGVALLESWIAGMDGECVEGTGD